MKDSVQPVPAAPRAPDGQRQVSPADFAARLRTIAASTHDGEAQRMLALQLVQETLNGLGYGAGLEIFTTIGRK